MRDVSGGDPWTRPVTSTDGAARARQVLRLVHGLNLRELTVAGQRRISTGFPWTSSACIQL